MPDSTVKSPGLDGTAWTMALPPGTTTLGQRVPTMRFEDGRVSGSDGCNRYTAPYSTSPGKLRISGPRAGTMMVCPTEDGAQLARIFDEMLSKTQGYRIDGTKLMLLDAESAMLGSFDAQADDLAGTAWQVGGYNNGRQAVVGVTTGSALSLAFDANGRLSGSGGCNRFTGSYRADGKSLSIGPLAATRKACAQPEGVMQQEAAYLRALESAATAQREGDRLELRTATGALAVSARLTGATTR